MNGNVRKWVGIGWLGLCLILFIVSGEARFLVLLVLMFLTMFLLGVEKLVKAVLGKN